MVVNKEVEEKLKLFFEKKKVIGATCIAPIVLARIFGTIFGGKGIDITLGRSGENWPYSGAIECASKFGNKLVMCDVDEICKDRYHNIVTTPAYMKGNAKPHEVFDGIKNMIDAVVKLI